MWGGWALYAFCHILVFGGAFLGTLLGSAWEAELTCTHTSGSDPIPLAAWYWRVGFPAFRHLGALHDLLCHVSAADIIVNGDSA